MDFLERLFSGRDGRRLLVAMIFFVLLVTGVLTDFFFAVARSAANLGQ